ncbi:MAG: translation initiation factor IF-2 [Christensenellales bacterium]|jgi:translation initiation factor IF-2
MAKVKGLESAKELQSTAQALSGEIAQTMAGAQECMAYLNKMEIKLVQREAYQAQQESEKARLEAELAMASESAEKAQRSEAVEPPKEQETKPSAPQPEKASEAGADEHPKADAPVAASGETQAVSRPAPQRKAAPPQATRPADGAPRTSGPAQAERAPAAKKPEGQKPAGRAFTDRSRPPMPKVLPGQQRPPMQRPPRPQGEQRPFPPRENAGARPGGYQQGARPFTRQPQEQRPFPPRDAAAPRTTEKIDFTPVEKKRVSNYDPNRSSYQRVYDVERRAPRAKREVFKENVAKSGGLDENVRFRKQRSNKRHQIAIRPEPIKIEHAVMTTDMISVKDLTEKLGKPAGEIIKKLFMLGIMATINNEIDYDTANLVAQEFGITLELKKAKTFEETLAEKGDHEDEDENLTERPPVVTIMGHVDHGKTSLLDRIRKSSVTETEAGGITQHIGAYTVTQGGKTITFLDTPGHEAFTAMRARGAQATDIAILVVAADDGIMPQTVEAINHAKAADVPIIIAINKIDKPAANAEKIKQQLTEYELVPEEWGGSTIVAEVSALTGQGIANLLEMILLVAEVAELKANPERMAKGIIVEAKLDKGRGPVATVLVQNGTLRVGDTIVAGTSSGRVRAMLDDKGNRADEAGPSMPIEVIGFNEVPNAGEILNAVDDDRLSRMVVQERRDKIKADQLKAMSRVTLDDLFSQISAGDIKDLNIIIKADVQGSVEAVKQALEKLTNDEVRVNPIHGGVGAINETDVMLASASNAIIIGFNVRPDALARTASERESVDIRLYRVIYSAIEDVEAAIKGMLAPKFKEIILGHAQVRQVFRVSGVGTVAGSYITDGVVRRNASVRLLRDNVVIFEGKLASLRRFKDDVREVASGYECGIGLENYNDLKEGDVIECFIEERINP